MEPQRSTRRPTARPPPPLTSSSLRLARVHRALASHPLSWMRCVIAIVSYALLVTDTLRTGLAITSLPKAKPVDPNVYHYYGPYAYRVLHLAPTNVTSASASPVAIWSYKYDSTSIILRALVKTLRMEQQQSAESTVGAWPACVTYGQPQCDERVGLSRPTVFAMIDSVIQHFRDHQPLSPGASSRHRRQHQHVLLRVESTWTDRLHEVLLSRVVRQSVQRTGQILSCVESRSATHRFPATCDPKWRELWSDARPAWRHFSSRLRLLRRAYPNATLESLVLQGVDDVERSAVLFHGQQDVDLVLLTRVRLCGGNATADNGLRSCATIAVDDFRFESAVYLTSVLDWRWIIGILRGAGQCYTWLRVVSLFLGVHHTTQSLQDAGAVKLTLRTFFLIPSQVVIYGSSLPILCYTIAFVLDSSVQNELIRNHFSSPLGTYKLDLTKALTVSSIAMRSVWLLALVGHALVALITRRSWSPSVGVVGIPEFFLTTLASATVIARLRVRSWRNSNVVDTQELPWSRSLASSRKTRLHTPTTGLVEVLGGLSVNLQFIAMAALIAATLAFTVGAIQFFIPRLRVVKLSFWSRSLVPTSSGLLWPTNTLVVSWTATMLSVHRAFGPVIRPRIGRRLRSNTNPPPRKGPPVQLLATELGVGHESFDITSFLVNLTAMTDPLTFIQLRLGRGQLIGIVETRRMHRRCRYLVPLALLTLNSDIPIDWDALQLVDVTTTRELTWLQLLETGQPHESRSSH